MGIIIYVVEAVELSGVMNLNEVMDCTACRGDAGLVFHAIIRAMLEDSKPTLDNAEDMYLHLKNAQRWNRVSMIVREMSMKKSIMAASKPLISGGERSQRKSHSVSVSQGLSRGMIPGNVMVWESISAVHW